MAYPTGGGRIAKEIDEYMLRVYKTNNKASESQRLPKFWNTKDRSRHLRLSHFALSITYSGGFSERHDSNYSNNEAACVRADAPIPLTTGVYYFEITISNKGSNGKSIAIGVATKASNLSKLPGTEHSSFGYHSDGSVFHGSTASSTKFGPRFAENDTVGCGVDFISRSLFFTRNGVFLGKAFEGEIPASPGTRLYPAIGLQGRGTRLSTNFGQRPFSYAFEAHIERERVLQENQLIERICKEEFAGPKMRELVSGYLVHHGYVSTAQAFSRWNSVPNSPIPSQPSISHHKENQSPVPTPVRIPDAGTRSSKSCESYLDSPQTEPSTCSSTSTPGIARRHSDSACLIGTSSPAGMLPLPGLASMLHRRRLRALCRRCQYGRAAATLNRLYPQVLERCPELLVQLRCRQLIEMMRRHAVRRGRNSAFDPASESSSTNSATAPPKVQKISGFQNVRSGCCVSTDRVATSTSKSTSTACEINQNGLARNAMDVDSECSSKSTAQPSSQAPGYPTANPVPRTTVGADQQPSDLNDDLLLLVDAEDDIDEPNADQVDVDDGNDDDDDDDGFGMDDDTGVSLNTLLPDGATMNNLSAIQTTSSPCSPHPNTTDPPTQSVSTPSGFLTPSTSTTCHMEVDEELASPTETNPSASTAKRRPQSTEDGLDTDADLNEMRCLLRHVQFGRSLVNLVKQVRAKVGGLSLETERLLQQSVSLLAYPSPAANSCPLRGLLDPVWRDTIASVINSAVLKAHDLPVQPALEQGLLALQRCFQDQYFVEAQTLGHFLLYHLTPSQLEAAERTAMATLNATTSAADASKTESVTSPPASSAEERFLPTGKSRGTRRATVANGHGSERRRRSSRRNRSHATDESQVHSAYDTEECSSTSSMEETLQKNEDEDDDEDEDEDEEEDEEGGHCHVDDSDDHDGEDDDDDDPDGAQSTTASRHRHHGTRDTDSSTGGGSHDSSTVFRGDQSPNGAGGNSGRLQSSSRSYGSSTVVHTQIPALRSRRALIARFCPSIVLDDPHVRVLSSSISSPTSTSHSSLRAGVNHPLRIQPTQAIPRFRPQPVVMAAAAHSHDVCLSDLDGSTNTSLGLDSAFHGPVSISNPYHRDLLSAVNDALKAYAGSLLLTDEEQIASCSLTPPSYRSGRGSGPPPPPSGGGACAP